MSMSIEIYTSVNCFYCIAAKRLLDEKNIRYVEHDVSRDTTLREKMLEKANGLRTVPQIFINDVHIGGCDELYEMDRKGTLIDMISNNINE
ncbi:MAG: glutaredoxin 3 [Hyphomicrobiales bacterium]|nr:MAG: glutaredoxin 3 [Hyphomicrobiales bacterium]|tara:strand:+ start:1121 stop:1393 length:273 start_codon:yes stop_codon:yes gene_type:complete